MSHTFNKKYVFRDILMFINFIYNEFKVKIYDISSNLPGFFYCFEEVLTSRTPNTKTFSITSA